MSWLNVTNVNTNKTATFFFFLARLSVCLNLTTTECKLWSLKSNPTPTEFVPEFPQCFQWTQLRHQLCFLKTASGNPHLLYTVWFEEDKVNIDSLFQQINETDITNWHSLKTGIWNVLWGVFQVLDGFVCQQLWRRWLPLFFDCVGQNKISMIGHNQSLSSRKAHTMMLWDF